MRKVAFIVSKFSIYKPNDLLCIFFLFVMSNTSLGFFFFLTYVAIKRNNIATSLYSIQVK